MGLSGAFQGDTAAESSLIWIFRCYYPDFIPLCAVKQQKFSYFKRFFPVILFLHQKTAISAHWKNFPVSISNPCIKMQGSDCRQKPDLRNKVSGFFYEEKCCKTLKFQRIKPVI